MLSCGKQDLSWVEKWGERTQVFLCLPPRVGSDGSCSGAKSSTTKDLSSREMQVLLSFPCVPLGCRAILQLSFYFFDNKVKGWGGRESQQQWQDTGKIKHRLCIHPLWGTGVACLWICSCMHTMQLVALCKEQPGCDAWTKPLAYLAPNGTVVLDPSKAATSCLISGSHVPPSHPWELSVSLCLGSFSHGGVCCCSLKNNYLAFNYL